jgi:hypothetical protein
MASVDEGRRTKNNEPVSPRAPSGRYHTGHVREEGVWKGDNLWFRGKCVAAIVQDNVYTEMWRVRLPNGKLSDMVNRTRAKEAAYGWAASDNS